MITQSRDTSIAAELKQIELIRKSSITKSPYHGYSTAWTYTVTLTVANEFGTDSETKTDYITVTTAGSPPV